MESTSLPGPVELLKSSWEILQARWKTLVVIQLMPLVVLIPLVMITAFVVGFSVIGKLSLLPEEAYDDILSGVLKLWPFFVVAVLVTIVVQLWSQVALIFAIKDRAEEIGFKEAYKRAWKVLRSYLWVSLLLGLSVIGGLLLLIVPGLIFGVWFAFSGYIVIDQGTKGIAALKASKALVKGRFWAVVLRLLVIGVLSIIFAILSDRATEMWKDTPMSLLAGLVVGFVSIVWTAYGGAYSWLLYKNLKDTR